MKYFEELKYEQISEILGTSVGALKASYHHAVKKIEAFFNQLNLLPKIKSYTYYESI
jgi:RNA polymerase sigma-70 factor (ECF subfamily)